MNEVLFELAGIRATVSWAGGAAAFMMLIALMVWWLLDRKKRTGRPLFTGQVMNGIGFGLLPGLAVFKAFQDLSAAPGTGLTEPLPAVSWLTESGRYMPDRIELAAAVAGFVILCMWLILKKEALPDNGDLLVIAVCVWAMIRCETESLRAEPNEVFFYLSWATVLMSVILWSVRRAGICHAPVRTAADLLTVSLCAAVNLLTVEHVFSVGSGIADFAVISGSAGLGLILTLILGGDLRRMMKKRKDTPAPQQQNPLGTPAQPTMIPQQNHMDDGQETIRISQQV